ncbi:MAG: hypothetical protein DI536_32985 [Archangium gephyra]|uniref:Periplasmic heavy metal sensor n=1 Tax=Archangium gephyra TaxID=48 RepID=A0A2W5SWI6_9BACT|nr:MAG: hypothetical protein DI536_32985 [Archangium gephyra]
MSMKTRVLMTVVMLGSLAAFAGRGRGGDPAAREERREERVEQARLMYVLAISEALDLKEADSIKLSNTLKVLEEKRRPLRQQMGEAMKSLKDAADGDTAAAASVDANVQKVLDGRAQMATLDKELFAALSQGQTPQKKAKLALVLARLNMEMKGAFKKGRR